MKVYDGSLLTLDLAVFSTYPSGFGQYGGVSMIGGLERCIQFVILGIREMKAV